MAELNMPCGVNHGIEPLSKEMTYPKFNKWLTMYRELKAIYWITCEFRHWKELKITLCSQSLEIYTVMQSIIAGHHSGFEGKKAEWLVPVSNRGPLVCETNVITTTPTSPKPLNYFESYIEPIGFILILWGWQLVRSQVSVWPTLLRELIKYSSARPVNGYIGSGDLRTSVLSFSMGLIKVQRINLTRQPSLDYAGRTSIFM